MLLSLAVNITPPAGGVRLLLHAALMVSSIAALAILGRPLMQSAIEEIRQRRVSIELLFLAGIGGALGASLHSTISGVGAIYYEVVAVLLTVYSIGRTLGAQSRARALAETRHLQRTFETCRKIAADGSIVTTRVAEIQAGDQIRVLAGEAIPIDGRVVQGQAFVCETPLTGEPFPVVRRAGDAVFAGSYSEDGELRISATVPGTGRR
jgi:cation transport ATPase